VKKTILVIAFVFAATAASAQTYTQQQFGGMTFTNGSNGYNATEQRFGNMTFGRDSLGNNWNTQTFGNQTFTTVTPNYNNRGW